MNELEAQGVEVILCPLLRNKEGVIHPSAEPWLARAWYTPFISPSLLRDALWSLTRRRSAVLDATIAPLTRVATTPNFLIGTLGILLKSLALARRLQAAGASHIHAHFATHPAMAAWIIRRLTGIPYSFTAHAHDIYVNTAMLREKIADASFVVAISGYNWKLLEKFGATGKLKLIHCGVDLKVYEPRRRRPGTIFTIASAASLQPYKGLEYLVRACALLRDRDVGPFRCEIAGGGELERPLRQLIAELGLGEFVYLRGPQPEENVRELLERAAVFVLPSIVTRNGKMEGLPVSLIEALALEVPVIATSISGVPELVRPHVTGHLVPPQDAVALADAIEDVRQNPEAAALLAREGRRLVEEEFSLVKNVRSLAELFRSDSVEPRARP